LISLPQIAVPSDAPAWARVLASLLTSTFRIIGSSIRSVEYWEGTASTTADAPFIVRHNLGTRPRFMSGMVVTNGNVYVGATDLQEWNRSQIKVRCDVAGAKVIIRMEA
jgi:hypothetical protein